MGFEDTLGVSARPSVWQTEGQNSPAAQVNVASSAFGQAFSQAWPVAARTPKLGQAELSALTEPAQAGAPAPDVTRTVASGDTLSALVKAEALAQGVQLSGPQVMRMLQRVASDNKIANVNRIFPGQQINMRGLVAELNASPKGQAASAVALATTVTTTAPAATALQSFQSSAAETTTVASKSIQPRHDVLDKTLARAVAKGFIPANEKKDVRDKILELAKTHHFNPDDFARMTLMESDGMNPRASNARCHGIIQFCDGSDRGAASAGFAANPKAILGLSVYQQLHLVDKYFGDVGLKNKGPAGLDDLYLSVLMPSARSEVRTDAPLSIGNNQAKALYEGRDTSAPMTRQSILQGLLKNAADRLGQTSVLSGRLQAIRTAAYEENTPQLQPVATRLR